MKRIILPLLAATLILQSCHDFQIIVRGTLFTDETLSTPMAHDTLTFFWDRSTTPIGKSITNAEGQFGFCFWDNGADNWDNTYQCKFQMDYGDFYIMHGEDTLKFLMAHPNTDYENLVLYPGGDIYGF